MISGRNCKFSRTNEIPRLQRINVFSDGGSRGNVGLPAIGVVICDDRGNCLKEHSEFIGVVRLPLAGKRNFDETRIFRQVPLKHS